MTYHAGGRQRCPYCEESLLNTAALTRHLKEEHERTEVFWGCPRCHDMQSSTPGMVSKHLKSCSVGDAVTASGSLPERDEGWCVLCSAQFVGKAGLRVHMTRRHPIHANAALPVTKVRPLWTDGELTALAREAIRLGPRRSSKSALVALIKEETGSHRTIQAITTIMSGQRYKDIHAECSVESSSSDESLASEGSADANQVRDSNVDALRRTIATFCERFPGSSAALYAREVLEGGGDFKKFATELAEAGRKARLYSAFQFNLSSDFSGVSKRVLKGEYDFDNRDTDEMPTIESIDNCYRERFEAQSQRDILVADDHTTAGDAFLPITPDEVVKCLEGMKKESAPGPDSFWDFKVLSGVDAEVIALIFNCWLSQSDVPKYLKECRTILSHKAGTRTDPGNYRPITIGSMWLRTFSLCLALRWSVEHPLSVRQKAFVPCDGC